MPNKMLIDATHPEETRVVVVRGNRVEEFDFETAQRKQLRGNIYLAKVTRVEPSLQAAFVEYGGNRHGFLAFSEIHPDYYQIPVADRQALIEAEEQAHREAEEESENRSHGRRRSRHRNARRRGHGERVRSDIVEGLDAGTDPAAQPVEGQILTEHAEGAPQEGEHLHADAEHHGEHDAHDHHEHDHHDHDHHEHAHDDHHHDHAHDHNDHGHDGGHDHHDHDHADETPAPVAAFGAEPVVAAEAVAEPQEATSEAHAEALAEAVTAAAEPADAVYAAGESTEALHHDADAAAEDDDDEDDDGEEAEEEVVESVGGDDVMEEVPERTFRPRRQYKIQEVIKRRQVMLVQVVKEERGNKGAALTTYLSLAGRYAVLMPNTARGGGISRKITSAQDRSRLKEVVQDLDVPEGMGIILRTAGAARTKPEIKRDFEYLIRMWETVRDLTLKSQAPTLVYEEGSLIKRSLRDLYNKEIDEISVAGESGYREARDFMKMLMPANVSAVKQYRDGQPLFSRMGVESQLDAMFSPTVQLRSGGYIVINQTEALVSIDVNSGRSTREHHIEDTALKTNLEAAEEVARQLRLRDLAGLIVIDFIDMDEKRNNRAVERKLSDCLRQDRARIQVGRISHFGLLEMSRQRIRASVLESSTDPCPHCGGTGHVRSVSSVALQLLRGLEEILMKGATHNLVVRTRTDVALYVLNHKRGHLRDLENGFKVTLAVIADPSVSGPQAYLIDRGEQVHTLEAAKALLAAQAAASPPRWLKRPMTTRSSIRSWNPRSSPRRPKVSLKSRLPARRPPSRTVSAASAAVVGAAAVASATASCARIARPRFPSRQWSLASPKRTPSPSRTARKARNRQPVASSRAAVSAGAGVAAEADAVGVGRRGRSCRLHRRRARHPITIGSDRSGGRFRRLWRRGCAFDRAGRAHRRAANRAARAACRSAGRGAGSAGASSCCRNGGRRAR
ncbi:ribonuclease E [Bradyrhizobium diazoefficiens]|uniref:Ribonuclease E n=1 Tax=Bradyrhizobium diazoefficiens TaxID=1355477 RepID=A0A0E4BW54_9BRAD|nr:ribonuclease E [Bradyrhizobium diazoefficiens]